MPTPLLIGVSARIHHPEGSARDLGGVYTKTLHYLEQSVAHWVISANVLVFMIPAIESEGLIKRGDMRLYHYSEALDGLVLQGGADIAPESYGKKAERPEWAGLGICRGCQMINVAFGGTLHQDIGTAMPEALNHRNIEQYEKHFHKMRFVQGTRLARLYPGRTEATVNTIHHQAVNKLGRGLEVEAVAVPDNVIEAIRWRGPSYVFGVQWHPEFMFGPAQSDEHLDGGPILNEFLEAAKERKKKHAKA